MRWLSRIGVWKSDRLGANWYIALPTICKTLLKRPVDNLKPEKEIDMHAQPDLLWLNVSPSLQSLHQPLLRKLARSCTVAQWKYQQNPDEASCLEIPVTLLHDYLKTHHRPIHLAGHGLAGLVGWLYAKRHPERVKSLTLLAVGANPAVDWQAHYYAQRQLLRCSRSLLLAQMAYHLFGSDNRRQNKGLSQMLEWDLDNSPSPHSLMGHVSVSPDSIGVPLLICGSEDDVVIDPSHLRQWQKFMKSSDRLWVNSAGRHFFHYFYPTEVAQQMLDFWQMAPQAAVGRAQAC